MTRKTTVRLCILPPSSVLPSCSSFPTALNSDFVVRVLERRTAVTVRAPLKRREFDVDLYSKVGQYGVITSNTALSQRGGFYCDACECLLKDSASYLDHINGKKRTFLQSPFLRPFPVPPSHSLPHCLQINALWV
jgi:hypothetical protein